VNTPRLSPDLQVLLDLFYPTPNVLGQFVEVDAEELPEPYRQLLAHGKHMTVTVEAFHGCPVDVRVLQTHITDTHYARKILLTRHTDGRVVQFGLVRLNLDYLGPETREEIESQQVPLGRVLIKHNVMREVRLLSLWQVMPGPDLNEHFSFESNQVCYGRTALIYCNGVPAVELLEIVTP
jgi:chorismate-pyruvate lyase